MSLIITSRTETRSAEFLFLAVAFTSDTVYGAITAVVPLSFSAKIRDPGRCVHFNPPTCVAEQVTITVVPEHAEIFSPSGTGIDVSVKALEPAPKSDFMNMTMPKTIIQDVGMMACNNNNMHATTIIICMYRGAESQCLLTYQEREKKIIISPKIPNSKLSEKHQYSDLKYNATNLRQ